MNKQIEELYNKLDAQDKIINEQVLEIARLKEWKEDLLSENIELENIRKEAIECIKNRNTTKSKKERFMSGETTLEKLLEILGDKE